jgi:hypothetical protein
LKAIGAETALNLREDLRDVGIVGTENGAAVKRNAIDMLYKGFFNILERSVVIQVIVIDIGNYRDGR